MKALVTGGSGFLGHHIIKELIKSGITPVVYDIVEPDHSHFPNGSIDQITFIKGDILDLDLLCSAMKGCEYVFHTAAIADIKVARKKPIGTMEINVVGTAKCLEAAVQCHVKRLLYASSIYTAGNRGSFYRLSKQTGEHLCKTYYEEFGLAYTIARYGSLYGREPNHWNFIYDVCKSLMTTGTFTYGSSPDAVREYIHISDASRETVRIVSLPEYSNKAVQITGHQRMKMSEFFMMIEEILGKKITVNYVPAEEQRHYVITPYSFDVDIPIRINLSTYIDISEGILDCLRQIEKELESEKNDR